MAAIGHRLQASRSVLKLSLQEMAGLLGIRTETLETWERGRALPDIEAMSVLAEKFRLSRSWFFRGDPSSLPCCLAKTLLKP
ncbi:MAG: helix-turn-helix transcriptional regulator [Magnetococcales bacterium]|nr:helix-turn-helix transcriptional regulator [Magnetococcales bacterium]